MKPKRAFHPTASLPVPNSTSISPDRRRVLSNLMIHKYHSTRSKLKSATGNWPWLYPASRCSAMNIEPLSRTSLFSTDCGRGAFHPTVLSIPPDEPSISPDKPSISPDRANPYTIDSIALKYVFGDANHLIITSESLSNHGMVLPPMIARSMALRFAKRPTTRTSL